MLTFEVLICFLEQVFQVFTVGNKMVAFCVLHRGVFVATDGPPKCWGKLNVHSVQDQSVFLCKTRLFKMSMLSL
jgi:hypothetical protein